ncbi:MAG: putative cobaltochelatase [Actinomycetota bacterium]|nr:putative cobaltochelatase [Actinomycetota bacterium]
MTAYPFSAVVGLDDLRLALLLNAVAPGIGGVLVRGEKGTAKSTIVRALAALLPSLPVVAGCRFACDPAAADPACPDGPHPADGPVAQRPATLVELPVGASEDRLVGSLDLERALAAGVKAYEPGLLAAAHRGVLYVDEVNLLHDHLVDLLLDAAAMGRAHVEREGVSVSHAARFLLVGTMNPEEGELRPQLLDRFGLTVEVRASREPAERAEVVRRRLAYEAGADAFAARWIDADRALAGRIAAARQLLPSVVLPDSALRQITAVCASFDVDGLRADLVTARTAIALAAWNGRDTVTGDDVRQAARLALPHRRRRDPFDAPGLDDQQLDDALEQAAREFPPEPEPDGPGGGAPDGADPDTADTGTADPDTADTGSTDPDTAGSQNGPSAGRAEDAGNPSHDGSGSPAGDATGADPAKPANPADAADGARASGEETAAPAAPFQVRALTVPGRGDGAVGRRSPARTESGRLIRPAMPEGRISSLHVAATVRAAAPFQRARGRVDGALRLEAPDLRQAVREGRESNLVLFCVDASGSMAARKRMSAVKGAVLSLLLDAYQRRDKVGLVTFRGADAEVTLPPTSSVEAGAARLRALPTGGRTPLAAGLQTAADVLRRERLRDARRRALLVVVTDGRWTAGPDPRPVAGLLAGHGVASVVIDCESGPVRLGLAGALATALGGPALRLEELGADALASVVRDVRRAA